MKEVSPVFIIGGSRTGSEMLKTMLSTSPELDFVDELFLYSPTWLHKDLSHNIREHVGDLGAGDALDRLLELLYSGIPYGWFWENVESQLDRDRLRSALAGKSLDMRALFTAIMDVHAAMRGKQGRGAKFPTHYSYTPLLLEWYPDCRLIHTTREPKAVYASQASKYVQSEQHPVSIAWLKFRQFVHINLQVSWTAGLHRKLRSKPNYRLVRYEDVVQRPETTIRAICRFLEVDYDPVMLQPKQYGSSFRHIGSKQGVDDSSLQKWRETILPATAAAIDLMHPRARRLLGY